MAILEIIIGFVLIFFGWIYLYKLKLAFKINHFFKTFFFNDAIILTNHKKIGLLLLMLAAIVLYLGFSNMKLPDFNSIMAVP
jgi:hypothetical protein